MSDYWKKKLDELEKQKAQTTTKKTTKTDYWQNKMTELEKEQERKKNQADIAPVKSTVTESGDEKDGDFWSWLGNSAMSGLANFNKSITSTADLILGAPLKALGWENNPISKVADYYNDSYDEYKEKATTEAKILGSDKNIGGMGNEYELAGAITESTIAAVPAAIMAIMSAGTSVAGSAVATGGTAASSSLATTAAMRSGNLLTKAGLTTQMMAKNPQYWLSFAQTYGNDYEQAVESGVDEDVALYGSLISSLVNAGIEIGIDGGSGIQGLPDKVANGDKSAIFEWVKSSLEEGGEEVLQGVVSRAVNKVTGGDETILDGNEMLTEGAMGTAVGALLGGGQITAQSAVNAVQEAQANKLTETEQKVVDKVVETRITEEELAGKPVTAKERKAIEQQVKDELFEGGISIDTIEEALGGDTYKAYKDTADSEDKLRFEFDTLNKMKTGDMTGEQTDRRTELKQQLEDLKTTSQRDQLKSQLSDEVYNLAKDTRLVESYNEKARRGQAFEADISKYDAKQQKVVQKAIDSGILNNTRRTHKFVDMIAKIAADKGVSFDFTNNERLKESSYAVEGATVNGYVNENGDITLNIDSAKATRAVVGHEVTHILEGTDFYNELQTVIEEYAQSKGEYDSRLEALTKLYQGKKGYETDFDAKVRAELTADLVGDYLFDDADFINNLSTKHRNIFEKMYDEIKYLAKVATAGTQEARELEKVKKAFEDAYRADSKASGDTKWSLTDNDGKELSKGQQDYFKDSKMRDDDGNLMVMYHGSQDAGFHEFNSQFSDDDTSFFFVDRNDVAASYSGTSEVYEARTMHTAEDVNNFIAEIGAEGYEVVENDGKYTLLYEGDRVSDSDSAKGIFDEFRWYEGVGEGDANYKVYLNLTNPLVVDAKGKNWNNVSREYSQEVADRYHSLTTEEKAALADVAGWEEYGIFRDELLSVAKAQREGKLDDATRTLASAYDKLGGANANLYDAFTIASDNFSEESINQFAAKQMTTRDYAQKAKAEGYDGVIFKNIVDNGGYSNGSEGASTVAIAFDSNQIKSTANTEPTKDADIRYSLTEYTAEEKKAHNDMVREHFGKTYMWAETGYLLLDGTKLDMSGKHDGAPGGYRTVDHRDIVDALGSEYGDGSYSGALVQFMSEGNIRIIPEMGGINLSVKPTEAQEKALAQYVQMHRGEIVLDIDDANGYTVASVEYPRGTQSSKVLGDIRAYFEDGTKPQYSLSRNGETNRYKGDVPMRDLALNDVAPVQDSVQESVQDVAPVQGKAMTDDYAPASEADVNAMAEESFAALDDTDAPMEREIYNDEIPDTTAVEKSALKRIADSVRDVLALNKSEARAVQDIVQKYSTTELPGRDALAEEIRESFGERTWIERNEEVAEIKAAIRKSPIAVSENIKSEYTEYGAWMRKQFGKVLFRKDGLPVDSAYKELGEMYPDMFPADIVNEADQLNRIVEVANMDVNIDNSYELTDADVYEAADTIINEVSRYKEERLQKVVEAESRDAFWSLRGVDPMADETTDIFDETFDAPVAEDEAAKTTGERLENKLRNAESELEKNKQLRQESWVMFDEKIERLKAEYNSKKNKSTVAANDVLKQIENLKRRRADVDADYAKRISDVADRINKMNTPEYKTAEQRRAKQDEYSAEMENLVGDTSTWVDKKLGLSYKTNTLRRNLRDVVRDANGNRDIQKADAIYDALQGSYNHNEAELNKEATRIKQPYAEMDITKAEDAYIQMLGELRHNPETTLTEDAVMDYYNKHKKNIDKGKVDKIINDARDTYDGLLIRVNTVLKEQGMKEIPYRKGYFPHFTDPKQGFLAKLFNWKTKDYEIPTDIAGLTESFNPNRSWQSFNKERKSDTTDYSFTKGMDTYVQGALDWIYHIEDIQKRRAFENHLRYVHSDEGVKERINKIRKNEEYDADEVQEQIDLVYKEAGNPLNNFVQDLRAGTNTLAGKKSSLDRGMEEMVNRKVYSTMTNLSNRVTGNMVAGSISSALTNFIPITQSWMEVSPTKSLRAMGETIRSTIRDDGVIAKSDFLTNRLRRAENLYKTGWDKVSETATLLMEGIDSFTSQVVWRSKYIDNISKGMSENAAIKNADQFAENVIAGRSRGNMPTIFDSKNPLVKALTAFQLEVNNQYGYLFKDAPQDVKNKSVARLATGYAAVFFGAYAYNALYSSLVGRDVAFDPIGIIEDLLRDIFGDDDDDEEKEPAKIIGDFAENIAQEIPFVGGLLGGGRVPISAAMPYDGISEMITGTAEDISDKDYANLTKEWLNPVYYLAMPLGGGQIKKSVEGLSMFSDKHPVSGSYTASGNLRYPVEANVGNVLQAGLFGQYSNKNARYYFDNDIAPLNENQIQEYKELDMPIRDYWDYRDGLKGLKTNTEKFAYVDGLDLPIDKKSILAYNIATGNEFVGNAKAIIDRYGEFDVGENYATVGDMHYRWYEPDNGTDEAGWRKLTDEQVKTMNEVTRGLDITPEQYWGNKAEYDMAYKHPEKYAILQEQGISVEEYKDKYEDSAFIYTDAYSSMADNPGKYAISKAVTGDVMEYSNIASTISKFEADKDENGKSISGSKKEKVTAYIESLDLDYGQKIILHRSYYDSKEDKAKYNQAIVEYLDSRDDISWEDMKTILEELDFTVYDDGRITW